MSANNNIYTLKPGIYKYLYHFQHYSKWSSGTQISCWKLTSSLKIEHCVNSVSIRSYSGPHFPAFGLTSERYGVLYLWFRRDTEFCISPASVRMWENAEQNNSEYGHFLRSRDLRVLEAVYLSSPSLWICFRGIFETNKFCHNYLESFCLPQGKWNFIFT